MRRRIKIWIAAEIALASVAALSLAQTAGDSDSPSPADKMLQEMLSTTTQPSAAATPTTPDTETVFPDGHSGAPAKPGILREGSDIVDRTGRLHKLDDSPYPEFVFDNDADAAHLAPMIVLPDRRLMQMEDAAAAVKSDFRFTVSGTLTEYDGKNYILLESEPRDMSRQVLMAMHLSPTTQPTSADQMLSDMLSTDLPSADSAAPQPHTPANDRTSGPGALPPRAPIVRVLQEGSEIIDRTGRLTHGADGRQAEFTFDSDGVALEDPPLIILPNLKLQTMGNAVSNANRDLRFRVTGTITEYRGRNCVLLEKVVVVPDSVQQF